MNNNVIEKLEIKKTKIIFLFILLTLILFFSFFISLSIGKADISIKNIFNIFFNNGEVSESAKAIIIKIRMPRIFIAIIIGAGLAVAGAVFQSLLMNPLADSYTMGVSSGAAFSAVLIIFLNIFIPYIQLPIILFSFIGAIATLFLVISIANTKGYLNSINLIISGIIMSSIFSAGISYIKSVSGENVAAIVYWLMGNLGSKDWSIVIYSYILILISIFICLYYSRDLNILSFGDKEAKTLGVNTKKLRIILLITGSLITAVSVSVAGIIGFIGLIVPHLLRLVIGSNNKLLIPFSALTGGILLLLSDTFARSFFQYEIPVGVITTLIGGPFFIFIFIKQNKTNN